MNEAFVNALLVHRNINTLRAALENGPDPVDMAQWQMDDAAWIASVKEAINQIENAIAQSEGLQNDTIQNPTL